MTQRACFRIAAPCCLDLYSQARQAIHYFRKFCSSVSLLPLPFSYPSPLHPQRSPLRYAPPCVAELGRSLGLQSHLVRGASAKIFTTSPRLAECVGVTWCWRAYHRCSAF